MSPASKPSNVIEALVAVMGDLPAIGKDARASQQQGGYAYRGIEAITQHTQPLFAKHGVVFTPRVVSYEIRELVINGKPWTDVIELVEYDVYGPGGIADKITVGPILAIGRDNSDKGGNKCLTQAYKYALIQALSIADKADDGDGVAHEADQRVPVQETNGKGPAPAPDAMTALRKEWFDAGEAIGFSQADLLARLEGRWKASKTTELTETQLREDIDLFVALKELGAEVVAEFKKDPAKTLEKVDA